MNVHLSLSGHWAECRASKKTCPRLIHQTGMTPAEAELMPKNVIEQLLEVMDPPTKLLPDAGGKAWYKKGQLHREHDLPALIYSDGMMLWYQHGKQHRGGGKPAIVYGNGWEEWYDNGQHHRDKDPAVIYPNGSQQWWWRGEEVTEYIHETRRAQSAMHARLKKRGFADFEIYGYPPDAYEQRGW